MADGGGLTAPEPMRPIEASDFIKIATPPDPGAAPMLQWVRIADLVVDDGYQRPVVGAGRTNVRRIAAEFRWSKFAPVICAPVAGGKFAVIDGQHRATAAALLGIESVPAQVIIADKVEQAAAFKSINGQVTRMHSLALHHAAFAAGDPAAKELAAVCGLAGVTILRYPRQADMLQAGETMALGSIADGLRTFGRETVLAGLKCITATDNNRPGILCAVILRALFATIGANQGWLDPRIGLLGLFADIDLEHELGEAEVTRRPKGTALWPVLGERLKAAIIAAIGHDGGVDDADPAPVPPDAAPQRRMAEPEAPVLRPALRTITPAALRREIVEALTADSATAPDLAARLAIGEAQVRAALNQLAEAGDVVVSAMTAEGWRAQSWRSVRVSA